MLQSKIMQIQSMQQRSQARGGSHYKVELKDLKTGAKVLERINAGQNLDIIELFKKKVVYLYHDDVINCVDSEYAEVEVPLELIPHTSLMLLQPDSPLVISSYKDVVVKVDLPERVSLEVIETGIGIPQTGENKTTSTKDAIVEGGHKLSVPEFIKIGDRILISVQDGTYQQRE